MKNKLGLNLITFYGYTAKNTDMKNQFVNEDSYSLFYDKETKGIFKAEAKNMSNQKYMLMFLILYPTMNFFPNEIIPYHNTLFFIIVCLITIFLSMKYGLDLTFKFSQKLSRITLTEEEWEDYLKKENKFYVR